jgi:long-chain acyl-CoA synthetase
MFARILTIQAALTRACRWYGNLPALISQDRIVTYSGLESQTRRIASGYQKLGIQRGDRIAFLCEASPEHALAYYAAHWLGAVTVNLHYRETLDRQAELIDRLEPSLMVYGVEKEDLIQDLRQKFPKLQTACLETNSQSVLTLETLMDAPPFEGELTVEESDAAIIQLSSGSTGIPKALVHSHASVLETWSGGYYMWSGIKAGDRFLNAFSPSFVVWLVHAGTFLNHGAAVLFQSHWNPGEFLRSVEKNRITFTALTPTQWRAVLEAEPEKYDVSSLKMAAFLGEKIAPAQLKELVQRICPEFSSFYGMSECLGLGGCVIRSSEFIDHDKWGSVGKPNLLSDLRIAKSFESAGGGKGSNETGEIVVRAASFANENVGDPDWRRRVLTSDGWYRTGDLGYFDDDGFVYLVGRTDNMISTGGIKVSAEEVEQVIESNPDIAEAMVLGETDEKWGERIVAVVVLRRADLNIEALDKWCREDKRLATFKIPKTWYVVDALPHNSVGKRDRKAMYETFKK